MLRDLGRRSSVFTEGGLERLSFEYVPPRLPHREEYVRRLVDMFRVVVLSPGALSQRVLLTGETGTGKTATAKTVGLTMERLARSRGLRLKYVHVNCRMTSSKFVLVQAIIREAAPELPLRGYGADELLRALWDYLNERDEYVLLVLDEIDYFIRATGENILYGLTRFTDSVLNVPQRLHLVFIARDHSFQGLLDKPTLSTFAKTLLEFPPYEENQLRDILRDRVKEAFVEGAVAEEILDFIARNAREWGRGDARYALMLLTSAGLIADRDGSRVVLPEHVREAQQATDPKVRDEDVFALPEDERYVLLAVARVLKREREAVFVRPEAIERMYRLVCEEFGVKPVGSVSLQGLLRSLEAAGIVGLGEGLQVGLPGVKAEILEKALTSFIKKGAR